MFLAKIRKAGYVWMVLYGAFAALLPRQSIKLSKFCWKGAFDGLGGVTPKPGYVRMTRAGGVGMLAAGLSGLALESRAEAKSETESVDDEAETVEVSTGE